MRVRRLALLVAVGSALMAAAALNLGSRSPDPIEDRAYRLIKACVEDMPVLPIASDKVPRVREYERWTAMPIGEAFERLERIAPALSQLRAATRALRESSSDDVIVSSGLGRSIAIACLDVYLEAGGDADLERSFADIRATKKRFTIEVLPPGP